MADLIRCTDWGATPLGDSCLWPESLLVTLNTILSSPIPASVYWGPHHVLLYNESYRHFLAHRHPESLGRPGAEVWREAWHLFGSQVDHTYRTAEAFRGHSVLIPIEHSGELVDHYWDYSLSPIYDPLTGTVAGIYATCQDVTEAVKTTQERDRLSERLQDLLESTSESVIMIDRSWRFMYLNRAAELFALPITGLVGKVIWEALPALVYDGSPNVYHYHQAMEHGESSEFESYYPEPINRWRHIQVRPATDGIVLFARDITERKRADAALKVSNDALAESEEELRWTIALSSQMIWTADPQGLILKHSGHLADLTGHGDEEILGDKWTAMMHPDDAPRMQQRWSHCVRTGELYDIEFRIVGTKGEHRWFRAHGYPRRDAEGRIIKWYGITDDIHERKQREARMEQTAAALAASEEEMSWTVKMSFQNPWTADGSGRLVSGGDVLLEGPGGLSELLLEERWVETIHPDDESLVKEAWNRSIETSAPFDVEHRRRRASGDFHWLRSRAYPRRNGEGRVLKWYGTTEDIDARKRYAETLERTAAALAASEEELRWTIQLNAQIPWTAGPDGALLTISDRWYGWTGTEREVVLGSGWVGVQHEEDVHKVLHAWTCAVVSGEPFDIEHRVRLASGEFCWIRSRAFPRRDAQGRIVRWYGTMEDIHARKQAEEGLRTSEKLAAVGRLATSIAHEINNPLEAVTNLLYLARTSEKLPEVLSYVETAEQELHRASVIANQTLRFQRQASAPIALYSDDLIENCLAVFQGKLQNSYVVAERRFRSLQPVTCYDGEIRQVFLNLVGNAIDAMQPGGGRLLVRTREATHPRSGARGLMLTVADTGTGISAEAQKRLFEPFFTTKGISGTGLGLWVSKDIVARHGGTLRLRSKPRRRQTDEELGGTVFTLFLPYDALGHSAAPLAEGAAADERLELATV